MKKLIASIAFAVITACTFSFSATAKETRTRESRSVSLENFDKISVGQGICVNYTPFGADSYATISAPEGVIDNIVLKVEDDCLRVDYNKDYASVRRYGEAIVNIIAPGLCTGYECHSAGTIDIKSAINAPTADIEIEASTDGLISLKDIACNKLSIECRSGSKVICEEVSCDDIVCESSSTSKVELTGDCQTCTLVANSHSVIEASHLATLIGNIYSGEECIVSSNIKSADQLPSHAELIMETED